MGFELSPKTDQEDGLSKDEAIQWTLDERGGLGVSVGFDFPDDSMESIIDECLDYERTDRRTLLKLLKSVLNSIILDGIPFLRRNESIQPPPTVNFLLGKNLRVFSAICFGIYSYVLNNLLGCISKAVIEFVQ